MQTSKIILFSGFARHGKDTTANILADELKNRGDSVLVYHFADALKSLCENSYGWIRGDKGPIGRTILQNVGSDYRKNNINCWVNICKEIAKGCLEKYVLIPDCRYKNEATEFNSFCSMVVRIYRPNFDNGLTEEQKNHISENDMNDPKYWDVYIDNDGTIEDLKKKVKEQLLPNI